MYSQHTLPKKKKKKKKEGTVLVEINGQLHSTLSVWVVTSENVPSDMRSTLRKHAYSNILKILPLNNEKNSDQNSDIFHISAQNIDCGFSLEAVLTSTHNLMYVFWAEIRKITYTPIKPSFTI